MPTANLFHPPLPPTGKAIYWHELHGASIGFAINQVIQDSKSPLLIIAPDSLTISHLIESIAFFGEGKTPFTVFPDWETLPYDYFSPHQDIISERLSALYHLRQAEKGAVITTINTLMQRLPPVDYLMQHSFILKVGDPLSIDKLRQSLSYAGYQVVSEVREHGEFAIRGSLIDLFPMGSTQPLRIDLLDDEVDSIRFFSVDTQRSLEKINHIRLLPGKEFPLTKEAIELFRQQWREQFTGNPLNAPLYRDISEGHIAPGIEYYLPLFFTQTASLFDYLPANATLITVDNLMPKMQEYWHEITTRYEQHRHNLKRPLLSPAQLFLDEKITTEKINSYARIAIDETVNKNNYTFATKDAPAFDIHQPISEPLQDRVLFCAETMGRREVLLQSLHTINLHPTLFTHWSDFLNSTEKLGLIVAPLEAGFTLSAPALAVITESQLYGKRVMQRRLRKKASQHPDAIIRDLAELKINDPIVHIDHGVGRYCGLQTLTVGDQIAEFLCIEYQDQAKLYVPVSALHLVSRYTGADGVKTPLNRLGTDQWARAKRKATEKVRDVAAELLAIYAEREARPGFQYTIPEETYHKFANAFPFEETPDQLQAIEQVMSDMTSTKPMDRVICGDVGFGKTEVALRAAFFAVINHKQVAFLVPTTLLAQQHFQHFQDRFADWPIQVEMLSRFRTTKEQKQIIERVKSGHIDILIGTHKLLQNDLQFKDLGLVIIDEEHRFGVKQKEKLKTLRASIDMLTLTATPIPRTLNMALAGIRDLSIIATPPARRLSVKTFLHAYNNDLIQEAILREMMRGGQVYFLHNDVTTIDKKAEEIATLVPEARPIVAHGQMHERDLERVMSAFYHRQYNVLVCSTIIESGIDIPTANTIIINRADKFGIAQLHQLRGRVGRSHHQAYAYLFIPAEATITADAKKRLEAITTYDDLGIGFTLSTHDLEIRGAGELLGEEQSGEMHEVGFTLYMELLSRAVSALKLGEEPNFDLALKTQQTEVDLHLPAFIPETYLADVSLRLPFYKHIASATQQSELDEIQVNMIDRFGLLPEQLKNLFAMTSLKLKAAALGIIKLEAADKGGKIEFSDKTVVQPETIIKLIQQPSRHYRLEGPNKLRFTLAPHTPAERVQLIEGLLARLSK